MAGNAGKGSKKAGRSKRKQMARAGALSQYVRGKITAQQYFAMIGSKPNNIPNPQN